MKKLKRAALVLLTAASVMMVAFLLYDRMMMDSRPPVIECPEEMLEMSASDPEERLLEGLAARDDRSGDVTDSIVVEKLAPITKADTRVVTYAAVDDRGNVSRVTRTVRYTDYKPPHFSSLEAIREPEDGRSHNLLAAIQASSPIDGDLTARIKYRSIFTKGSQGPDTQFIELRVTDSFGYNAVLTVEVEEYDPSEEPIEVELSSYLVYVPAGTPFEPKRYYQGASEDGTLKIESDVNVMVPGTYAVSYTVTGEQEDRVGKSRLIVVVEE